MLAHEAMIGVKKSDMVQAARGRLDNYIDFPVFGKRSPLALRWLESGGTNAQADAFGASTTSGAEEKNAEASPTSFKHMKILGRRNLDDDTIFEAGRFVRQVTAHLWRAMKGSQSFRRDKWSVVGHSLTSISMEPTKWVDKLSAGRSSALQSRVQRVFG